MKYKVGDIVRDKDGDISKVIAVYANIGRYDVRIIRGKDRGMTILVGRILDLRLRGAKVLSRLERILLEID